MLGLTLPDGRSYGPRSSLLALRYAALGRSSAGKVKLYLLPSSVFLVSDFLDPVICWNFSAGHLDFHKDSLVCGDCLNQRSFGGKRVENSYFTIMMTSLL